MTQTDAAGRAYAEISALKDGQTVWLDGGFTCHRPGPVRVHRHGWLKRLLPRHRSPFFICEAGQHSLDGQAEQDGTLVGVYLSDPGPLEWQA